MPYRDFTLDRISHNLGVTVEPPRALFPGLRAVSPDPQAWARINGTRGLATTIATEKARSEFLVAPLLAEVWRAGGARLALYSGVTFDVDPAADLTGECDFLLGAAPQLHYVANSVAVVVKTVRDKVVPGLGPCAAGMVAAQRFNQRRCPAASAVYGCVTSGTAWQFLRLTRNRLEIDLDVCSITAPDSILGRLLHFVGLNPPAPVAPAAPGAA